MRREIWLASAILLSVCTNNARAQIDPDDLRFGLVATYRDTKSLEVNQLEPIVALNLKSGESPHPRLTSDGGGYRWEGYLNILRAGDYQLSATLRGKLRVVIAGKTVLAGENNAASAEVIEGPTQRLVSGFQPIVVEFTRQAGPARLQLLWKAPFFHKEPLPHQFFKHDPAKAPQRLAVDRRIEEGRLLAEELACAKCHQTLTGLQSRQGPELTHVGERAFPGWIYRWLQDPKQMHAGAVMPKMFADDATGRTEAYAVTRFLIAGARPTKSFSKKQEQASPKRGEQLFTTTGCIACHADKKKGEAEWSFIPPGRSYPLGSLANKTTALKLTAYLQDPLAVDPSGRMPKVPLDGKEIADLAAYLCAAEPDDSLRQLPAAPSKEEKPWVELGRQLFTEKGCANCHEMLVDGKPLKGKPTNASLANLKERGCVAEKPTSKSPWYVLTSNEREALQTFIREGITGANSPAPAHAVRADMVRFNCLACHARDGEGGLTTEITEELRRLEKAEFAEAVSPPPLTGVGGKLRNDWLHKVLTETGRGRPWMGLRMPQFGKANVGKLAEGFCSLEGVEPQDTPPKLALTASKIEAGKHLVGKSAFGCVTCHDVAGIPASGTRGPDLAFMNQRVRYDWYRRWMEQAQRMQPGTRMPTVFPDGQSTVPSVLSGNADAQAEAIWTYLSLGANLPLPEGVGTPKGRVLLVQNKPVLLRTFMPESGTKSIAVGFPGISTVFDAGACRLAYAWSGNFLDVSPVWDNRGGAPAKVLGTRFWTAPPGFPWAANRSNDPPDFVKRRTDPAWGAPLAEGKVFEGEPHLFFKGYANERASMPAFRYEFDGPSSRIQVEEHAAPIRSSAGVGIARHFDLAAKGKQNLWLLTAEAPDIRWLNAAGNPLEVAMKDRLELPVRSHVAVVPQGNDRVAVLRIGTSPDQSRWVLRKVGSSWQLLVNLSFDGSLQNARLILHVWGPYRDEPALLRDILSGK